MRILGKRILSIIVTLILMLLLISCSVQKTSNNVSGVDMNKIVTKSTTVPTPMAGIEVQSPVMLSNSECTFNGQPVNVRLKMVKGRYYEDWNPGPYMGTLWEGSFIIELSDEYGKTISTTDISKMYSFPLIFKSAFKIEFDDYNNDGDLDFTIGQYASSNGNVYRIFTLRKSGKVEELLIKDYSNLFISKSTGYYSTKLTKTNETAFEIEYYDNSVPVTFHDVYKWDGKQFVLEKSQKMPREEGLSGKIDDNVDKSSKFMKSTNSKSITQSTSDGISTSNNKITATNAYSNPIDEYFIPRINNALSQAGRREYQDTYRVVWKSEFENIMRCMYKKCKFQKDRDNLILYENSVKQLIDSTYNVVVTDWLESYKLPPESSTRNSWGNGTRSGLNQIQAEIYRDAGMRLVGEKYTFLDKDYSKEHYE